MMLADDAGDCGAGGYFRRCPCINPTSEGPGRDPTQDMLALNIDLASGMQAGRWKATVTPIRHGEEVHAGRGGMARAAKAHGMAK